MRSAKEVDLLRNQFGKQKIGKKFVKELYSKGLLDKCFDKVKPEKVARGRLGNRFAVHHVLPLKAGGSNDFSNLIVIEKKLHKRVHKHFLDPWIFKLIEGEEIEIEIPDLPILSLTEELNDQIDFLVQEINRKKQIMQKDKRLQNKENAKSATL